MFQGLLASVLLQGVLSPINQALMAGNLSLVENLMETYKCRVDKSVLKVTNYY